MYLLQDLKNKLLEVAVLHHKSLHQNETKVYSIKHAWKHKTPYLLI